MFLTIEHDYYTNAGVNKLSFLSLLLLLLLPHLSKTWSFSRSLFFGFFFETANFMARKQGEIDCHLTEFFISFCFLLLETGGGGSGHITAVVGEVARIPCELTPTSPQDSAYLVLWYKDIFGTPIYRWFFISNSLAQDNGPPRSHKPPYQLLVYWLAVCHFCFIWADRKLKTSLKRTLNKI